MPRFAPYGFIRQLQTLFTVKDGTVVVETFANPNAAVTNRFVTTVNMKVGAYTVANSGVAADGYAHLVTATVSKVVENDTMGTLVIVGIDNDGVAITDTLTLNNGDTSSGLTKGVKAFKRVDTVTGVGWVSGGTPDTIVVGFSAEVGLARAAAADADILTVYDAGSLAATASFTGKGNGTLSGTYFTATGANTTLDYTVVYKPSQSAVLVGTGAITIATTAALGFQAEIEAFGFRVGTALAGTGGTHDYVLKNGSNVVATLTVALASGAAGATIETTTITDAYRGLVDASTLTVARLTGGTTFTAGDGAFYVRLRQKAQRAS